jgi:hypothetical protein
MPETRRADIEMENNLCGPSEKTASVWSRTSTTSSGTEEQDSGLTPFKLPNQSFCQGVLYFDDQP